MIGHLNRAIRIILKCHLILIFFPIYLSSSLFQVQRPKLKLCEQNFWFRSTRLANLAPQVILTVQILVLSRKAFFDGFRIISLIFWWTCYLHLENALWLCTVQLQKFNKKLTNLKIISESRWTLTDSPMEFLLIIKITRVLISGRSPECSDRLLMFMEQ